METSLLYLILDVALAFFADITQDLAQNPLQSIVPHLSLLGTIRVAHRTVTVVCNIHRSAKTMTTLIRGIAIVFPQSGNIFLRTQNATHNDSVQGHSFHIQTVKEIPTYRLQ